LAGCSASFVRINVTGSSPQLFAGATRFSLCAEVIDFADATVEPNGVEHRDGREQSRLAFSHELPNVHLPRADQAGYRSSYIAVAQVELRGVNASLGGEHRGLAHIDGRNGVVQVLLGDGALFRKRLEAGHILFVLVQGCLGLLDATFGSGELLQKRLLVEQNELLTLFDLGALLKGHAFNERFHASADFHVLRRVQLADDLRVLRRGRRADLDHLDGGGRWGRGRRLFAARRGESNAQYNRDQLLRRN
jgi:hypothetical protein